MSLNPPKGNMFDDCYTWNPLGGACPHQCNYCYATKMKLDFDVVNTKYSGEPYIIEEELHSPLLYKRMLVPHSYNVFVCDMTDLFAENVKSDDISRILAHTRRYQNEYLFLTKNPARYLEFVDEFPQGAILGTTIETNKQELIKSKAPLVELRKDSMMLLPQKFKRMVSIEPIMDFDYSEMIRWIHDIKPSFVWIGTNTNEDVILPEPIKDMIKSLIDSLQRINIKVKPKQSLNWLGINIIKKEKKNHRCMVVKSEGNTMGEEICELCKKQIKDRTFVMQTSTKRKFHQKCIDKLPRRGNSVIFKAKVTGESVQNGPLFPM